MESCSTRADHLICWTLKKSILIRKVCYTRPWTGPYLSFAMETGFKQGVGISPFLSYAFQLFLTWFGHTGVMPTIKSVGTQFKYAGSGSLHEASSRLSGDENLLCCLEYAAEIALMSNEPSAHGYASAHSLQQRGFDHQCLLQIDDYSACSHAKRGCPWSLLVTNKLIMWQMLWKIIVSDGDEGGVSSEKLVDNIWPSEALRHTEIRRVNTINRMTKLEKLWGEEHDYHVFYSAIWSIEPTDVRKPHRCRAFGSVGICHGEKIASYLQRSITDAKYLPLQDPLPGIGSDHSKHAAKMR